MDYDAILTKWLDKNGVPEEIIGDKSDTTDRNAGQVPNRKFLRKKEPDAVLDLHGKTHDEAWASLDTFFDEAHRNEYQKVLIIHGKGLHSAGDSILEKTVRSFIEKCVYAGESGYSAGADGGSGSTWVLIKNPTNVPGK